jgi:hypothetical protein
MSETNGEINNDNNNSIGAIASVSTNIIEQQQKQTSNFLPNFANMFDKIQQLFQSLFSKIDSRPKFTVLYLGFLFILYAIVNKKNTNNVFKLYCIGFWIFCIIFIAWLSNPFDNKNTAIVADATATNTIDNNKI